ncbi:MAG: SusC/RagA family TonB-linked outer membrane protein, partial [Cyclobacteriaceae bacterium]|nr:SusC/RagA family TonB-linked outer membrane protein [Cyclobacteriaceae bacterium]
SGGDEKTTFLLSGSYTKRQGIIRANEFERGTVRLNITHKPVAKLTLGLNLSMSMQRTLGAIANGNFVNGPFQAAFTAQPTSPALAPDGSGWALYPLRSPGSHLFGYNIRQGVEEEVRLGRTPQTVSSFNVNYEIMPGLSANAFAGVDASFGTDNNQRPGSIPVFAGGQMAVTSRRTIAWNTNFTLNYTKKIANDHSLSVLAGFEYRNEARGGVTASQFTFANPALRLLSQGATARPASEFYFDNARQGFFGQIKYVFKDRYIADFTLRRDGSSRFGSQTKYGNFYAGSLAWRLSEESFIKDLNFFQDLKIRGSYGKVGNSEIADYDWFTAYGTPSAGAPGIAAGAQYSGGSILRLTRLGNDFISWEEKYQTSFGIDYSIFNGRLFGSVEYYNYQTKELLFDVPKMNDGGINTVRGNSGEVLNKGFDIELGGVVIDTKGFKWEAKANFSTLQNELVALPNNQKRIGNTLIVGQPIQFNYLFEFAGINPANGKAMIYDTLGNLAYRGQNRDASVKGSPIPTWFGGFSNTFSYKGLSLEVFFQFSGGNKAFNGDLYNLYASGSNANNQLTSQLNRWQQPGDITNVARPFQGGSQDGLDQQFGTFGTTQFLSDASYIRLKQIRLSYNLPSKLVSKVKLSKCNIFIQGQNLWTYTKFTGIDPEVIVNNAQTGVSSFGAYPVSKQFSAGITIGL